MELTTKQGDLDEERTKREDAEVQLNMASRKLEQSGKDLETERNAHAETQKKLEAEMKERVSIKADYDDLLQKLEEEKKAHAETKTKMESLDAELRKTKIKLEVIEGEVDSLTTQLQSAKSDKEKAEAASRKKDEVIKKMAASSRDQVQKIMSAKSIETNFETQKAELETKIKDLSLQITSTSKNIQKKLDIIKSNSDNREVQDSVDVISSLLARLRINADKKIQEKAITDADKTDANKKAQKQAVTDANQTAATPPTA